jgi:hypothetical protein
MNVEQAGGLLLLKAKVQASLQDVVADVVECGRIARDGLGRR